MSWLAIPNIDGMVLVLPLGNKIGPPGIADIVSPIVAVSEIVISSNVTESSL